MRQMSQREKQFDQCITLEVFCINAKKSEKIKTTKWCKRYLNWCQLIYFGTFLILFGDHEFGSKINIFGANCALELVQN